MPDKNVELLSQAVEGNVAAVLSLPSGGQLRHFKSRFLGLLDGQILLQAPGNDELPLSERAASGEDAAVCFRAGVEKVLFTSPIVRFETVFWTNGDMTVLAVVIEFPTEIKSVQRRNSYRAPVPANSGISLHVWKIPSYAILTDRPLRSQEIKTELRDLGTGGAGVRLIGRWADPPEVTENDRLRLELKEREQSWVFEGRMRPPAGEPEGNAIVTGIRFKKLDQELEGRRALAQITRIVGELQLSEVRRARTGGTFAA
jgi:c-di-GMP-binding flagellar brake protein YcgR